MNTKNHKTTPENSSLSIEIGKRLKEERKRLGLSATDFESHGGWPASTVYGWEAGKSTPKAEFLANVEPLGFDLRYVVTGHRSLHGAAPIPASDDDSDVVHVPLYSATGSMGNGNDLLTEDVLLGDTSISRKWLALNLPHVQPKALQMIHAYGDSMHGTLNSGDFALVDTDVTGVDIDGVYVLEADGQLFIKRVTRRMDGQHEVSSDNPNVKTVDVLDGSQQVRICGRVVYGWNGRRF